MKKLLITFPILLVLVIILTYYLKTTHTIKEIKNKYNDYVITNKETNIFDEQKNIIGTIDENIYLELENKKISKKDKYFKIKDTNYYIYYEDINKTEKKETSIKDYYVNIKSIKTNNPTELYQDNKKITINSELEFNAIKQDETYYYVSFLNQILKIKKENIQEKDLELQGISNYISIINYNNVSETCDTNDCITPDTLKEQLNYLKENNYYTITTEDLNLWVNDQINLKEKAILLTSEQELNEISKEYNFKIQKPNLTFTDSNTRCEKGNTALQYNQ